MLTGAELLTKVKERGDVSKSDLVRSAGYVSTKKDGTERLNFTAFYEVLLEAKGVSFGDGGGSGGKGRPGRSLRWPAWRRVCRYSATTALTCAWSMASASAMAMWHRCRAPASPIASDRGRCGAEPSAPLVVELRVSRSKPWGRSLGFSTSSARSVARCSSWRRREACFASRLVPPLCKGGGAPMPPIDGQPPGGT